MKAVAAGDTQAFTTLVTTHLPAIHHYALRLTGSRADADGRAQDTFLAARTRARSYRARRGRLSTWLHRIAHNLWVDQLRKRRPAGNAEELADEGPGSNPERDLAQADRATRVNAALARLPDNQRSAVVLCTQQGMTNAEAARIMGSSVRAVESLLARARRSLKSELSALL